MSEAAISPELIAIYLEDAREHLEALDHCLLALEREGYDLEIINAVLGPLHTLKGNSGMLGFSHIKEYVHRLEDVFARISDGRLSVEASLFDVMFAGASALRDAVERACQHSVEQRTFEEELAAIENLSMEAAKPLAAPAALARTSETKPEIAPAPTKKGSSLQYLAAPSNILRVDFTQLDHLLNLVGELVIYRTKLQQVGRRLSGVLESRERSEEFLAVVDQVTGVSTQLQGAVMQIRMLPSATFSSAFRAWCAIWRVSKARKSS